jgi:hypothetical protein
LSPPYLLSFFFNLWRDTLHIVHWLDKATFYHIG